MPIRLYKRFDRFDPHCLYFARLRSGPGRAWPGCSGWLSGGVDRSSGAQCARVTARKGFQVFRSSVPSEVQSVTRSSKLVLAAVVLALLTLVAVSPYSASNVLAISQPTVSPNPVTNPNTANVSVDA